MPAKKAPKKSAGKKATKKTAVKKPVAKKAAPKKATPKKAVGKKAPVKKSAAKSKVAPKKSTAKKTAAKKAAPEKAVAKKGTAKKAAPKRTAAKKRVAKKSPSRKTAVKAAPKESGAKKKATSGSSEVAGSPELEQVSCQLASLALAQEANPLSVRQREQLRRALATAGEELGWIEPTGNGSFVAAFSGDVIAMAKNGAKSLGLDLAEQLVQKKTEIAQLNRVIEYARELAEDPHTVYPADILIIHTIRDPYQQYVTKTETKVVNDADEARSAAASVERSLSSWSKHAEAMILDLKKRQKQLDHVAIGIPEFVESSYDLLGEVVANLA